MNGGLIRIFVLYECSALVYVNIDQGIHKGKSKFARIEKREKLQWFSITLNIANFEAFCWNILMSINFLFLKNVSMCLCKVTPSF